MNLVWIGAGFLLGIVFLFTQWQAIRKLKPAGNLASAMGMVILSGAARLALIGAAFLAAVRVNYLNGLLLIAGFLIARWLGLIYMHKK